MNTQELVERIIPPTDYEHRNGFNNRPLIDDLNDESRKELEDALVNKLLNESSIEIDPLLVDTLGYLRSTQAVPALRVLLSRCPNDSMKIVLATTIFEVSKDRLMIPIVLSAAEGIVSRGGPYCVSALTSAFYYLVRFRVDEVERFVRGFKKNEDTLIAYNARRALKIGREHPQDRYKGTA